MEDLNQYKNAYASSFQFYDENIWYLTHYSNLVCRSIRQNRFKSVLSLGIGHNVVVDRFQKEFDHSLSEHIILDGSEELIREFQAKRPNCQSRFFETYFENYQPDRKFDAIEMGFVLEHVDEPSEILAKYKQFLNDSGVIYIAVPNARSLHRLIGHHAGLLEDVYQLSKADNELGHKRYFDLESIAKLVQESGLTISTTKGLMLKPVTGRQLRELEWGKDIIHALFAIGEEYPEMANCIYLEAKT